MMHFRRWAMAALWTCAVLAFPTPTRAKPLPDETDQEIEKLRSGTPDEKASAAWFLGNRDADRVLGPLTSALDDKEARVRSRVAEALGELGDKRAAEPLLAVLRREGEDDSVLCSAAGALAELGDKRAVEPVRALLGRVHPSYCGNVRCALAELGDTTVIGEVLKDFQTCEKWARPTVAQSLGRLGDKRAVEPLIAALAQGSDQLRCAAARALGRIGDKRAVAPLIKRLTDTEGFVREAVVAALGELGDPAAIEPLMTSLANDRDDVREAAAAALGKLGPGAFEPLMKALQGDSEERREAAALGLGALGDPRAIEPLVALLGAEERGVCDASGSALVAIGPAAFEPLVRVARSKDDDGQYMAIVALGKLGDKRAFEPLKELLKHTKDGIRGAAAMAICELSPEDALEPLLEAVRTDPDLPIVSYQTIRHVGPAAVEPLIELLGHEREVVRLNAALAMEWMSDPRAVAPLIASLKDSSGRVRRQAAKALGRYRDDRAVAGLVDLLKRGTYSDEQIAIETLERELKWTPRSREEKAWYLVAKSNYDEAIKLGKVAYEPLVKRMRNAGYGGRQYVPLCLAKLGDKRAIGPLVEAMADERIWAYAGGALKKFGADAVDPLLAALGATSGETRRRVMDALAEIGDKRAVGPLVTCLRDGDCQVRQAAAKTLDRFQWQPAEDDDKAWYLIAQYRWDEVAKMRRRAHGPLKSLLMDPQRGIRRDAAEALDKAGWQPAGDEEKVSRLIALDRWQEVTEIGAPAVEPLVAVMKLDSSVTAPAAMVLGEIGDKRAVEPLLGVLQAEREEGQLSDARGEAARALGQLGDKRAVEPLIEALKTADRFDKPAVIVALGKLGDERAVGPLVTLVREPSDHWGGHLSGPAIEALAAIGAPAVPSLAELLKDERPHVQLLAVEALGRIGDKRAVGPLVELLKKEELPEGLLNAGITALVALKDPRAAEVLLPRLTRGDFYDRNAIAQALDEIGWKPANDTERAGYLMAMDRWDQLAAMGQPATKSLIPALKDEAVQRQALATLVAMGQLAVEPLIKALDDRDPEIRGPALAALGRIGDKRAVEPAIARLKDDDVRVRRTAATVLGLLGDKRAVEPLKALLEDKEGTVQRAALAALEKLGGTGE